MNQNEIKFNLFEENQPYHNHFKGYTNPVNVKIYNATVSSLMRNIGEFINEFNPDNITFVPGYGFNPEEVLSLEDIVFKSKSKQHIGHQHKMLNKRFHIIQHLCDIPVYVDVGSESISLNYGGNAIYRENGGLYIGCEFQYTQPNSNIIASCEYVYLLVHNGIIRGYYHYNKSLDTETLLSKMHDKELNVFVMLFELHGKEVVLVNTVDNTYNTDNHPVVGVVPLPSVEIPIISMHRQEEHLISELQCHLGLVLTNRGWYFKSDVHHSNGRTYTPEMSFIGKVDDDKKNMLFDMLFGAEGMTVPVCEFIDGTPFELTFTMTVSPDNYVYNYHLISKDTSGIVFNNAYRMHAIHDAPKKKGLYLDDEGNLHYGYKFKISDNEYSYLHLYLDKDKITTTDENIKKYLSGKSAITNKPSVYHPKDIIFRVEKENSDV